ncbi:hypothetical protein [Kribbella sp. NPDC051620]|uniref:hypothetical protein n=1 Tax=Kribbella sp. NPDC051620 TaxID=3364120 RepID=UPI00378F50DF
MDTSPEDSVLANLGQATWTAEEGVSYEVAVEGINLVIGAYSGLIGREEATAEPDRAKIENWIQEQHAWSDRRRALSPADQEAVRAVRQECRALLATLRATR